MIRKGRAARSKLPRAAVSLVLLMTLSIGGAAHAVTVSALQGQVLVSSGQGYRLVDGSTQLGPGGTVVANPGAVAQVIYAGGCRVNVEPGSVYLVASTPPCLAEGPIDESGGAPFALGVNPWLIGGAAIAVGGGAALLLSDSGSASP